MIEPSLANLKLDPPAVPAGKTIITYVFYYEYNQVLKDMKQNINLIDSVDHAVTSVEDVDPPVLGLNAVRIYDDPFNGKPHVLVSCEWDRCFYTFSKVIRKMVRIEIILCSRSSNCFMSGFNINTSFFPI